MPYIKQSEREKYNDLISEAFEKLKEAPVGHINYVISSVIWKIWRNNPGYTLGNNLMGTLDCIMYEFYRKNLAGYEDEKEQENGPVL